MKAYLISDEPLTIAIGGGRLRSAGFEVSVGDDPEAAIVEIGEGGLALVLIDLDARRAPDARLVQRLRAAARASGCLLVATSAGPLPTGVWPLAVAKPFTRDDILGWRAHATPRLGMREATPFSLERLAESIGGHRGDAVEMLLDYEAMALEQHGLLRQAIAAEAWPRVAEVAHKICGSLGAIEAREAALTCRALMVAAGTPDAGRARTLSHRVLAYLDAVEQGLSNLRDREARAG